MASRKRSRRAAKQTDNKDKEFINDDNGKDQAGQAAHHNEEEEERDERESGVPPRNVQKQPCNAWVIFLSEFTRKEKAAMPTALSFNVPAVSRLASDRWRSMSKEEKASYETIAAKNRADFNASRPANIPKKSVRAIIETRCSPTSFSKVIKNLIDNQMAAVRELGFGGLLHLNCTFLCRQLCKWLVEHFDINHCCLHLGDGQIYPITPDDVALVMGLPATGVDVPTIVASDDVKRIREEYNCTKTGVPYSTLVDDLKSTDSGDRFCRSFVLYALGILLCPTLKMESSPKLFPAIVDVKKICTYNWSKIVLEWLVREVKEFRAIMNNPTTAISQKKVKCTKPKTGLGGCLLFLTLFYFDRAATSIGGVPREIPRLKGWTNALIRKRESEVKRLGLYDDKNSPGLFKLAKLPPDVDPMDPVIVVAQDGIKHAQGVLAQAMTSVVQHVVNVYVDSRRTKEDAHPQSEERHPEPSFGIHDNVPANSAQQPSCIGSPFADNSMGQSKLSGQNLNDGFNEMEIGEDHADYKRRKMSVHHKSTPPIQVGQSISAVHDLTQRPRRIVTQGASIVSPFQRGPTLVLPQPNETEKAVYCYATRKVRKRDQDDEEVVVEMLKTYVTRAEMHKSMRPRGMVSNFLVCVASRVLLEKESTASSDKTVQRPIIEPTFSEHIAREFPQALHPKPLKWDVNQALVDFSPAVEEGNELDNVLMIFLPLLFEEHWVAYVINIRDKRVDILDSCKSMRTPIHTKLDIRVRKRVDEVMHQLYPSFKLNIQKFPIQLADVPQPENGHDCGIFLIKFMEYWDGYLKSNFDQSHIQRFREQLVAEWVLHPLNVVRDTVCAKALKCGRNKRREARKPKS